jgi:CSLREA domain-containing protein
MFDSLWKKCGQLWTSRAARRRSPQPDRQRCRPQLEQLAERSTPAIFTVTTTADSAVGSAVSLREAIQMANATAGQDTITFAADLAGKQITLAHGQLNITDDLIIKGPAQRITIDAEDQSRIFGVHRAGDSPITIRINNLRLIDGRADSGGAILNGENLTLNNVILASNVATGAHFNGGGAVLNRGNLTLRDCALRQNQGREGGAIKNDEGQVTLIRTALTGNTAANGGAIDSRDGRVTLDLASLTHNSAASTGGAIFVRGGPLTVTDSTLSGNVGNSFGGAVAVFNGTAEFFSSTLANNRTDSFGSAIRGLDSALTLTNSTVANNSGAAFFSGAIDIRGGSLTLRNSTVAGTRDSSGVNVDVGTVFTLSNSIIARSEERDVSNAGTLILQGNNLVKDGSIGGPGVLTGDPLLGPLAYNGGPTQTLLPQAGSPVINAGDNAFAPDDPFDQRGPGFNRIEGGTIDLGAVEVQV